MTDAAAVFWIEPVFLCVSLRVLRVLGGKTDAGNRKDRKVVAKGRKGKLR